MNRAQELLKLFEQIPAKEYAQRLTQMKKMLIQIDKLLDSVNKVDPWGDVIQNFEDDNRKRHTKRLIKMIDDDLKDIKR